MDRYKETHRKGMIGEMEFALHLVKRGWNIFKPLDPNSRADLLIERNGEFKKVQIKYCTPYKGCLRIELTHPMRKTLPYALEEIDEIGAFDPKGNKFYLIPLKEILPRGEIWIRVSESNNKQIKNINWGNKYLIE